MLVITNIQNYIYYYNPIIIFSILKFYYYIFVIITFLSYLYSNIDNFLKKLLNIYTCLFYACLFYLFCIFDGNTILFAKSDIFFNVAF